MRSISSGSCESMTEARAAIILVPWSFELGGGAVAPAARHTDRDAQPAAAAARRRAHAEDSLIEQAPSGLGDDLVEPHKPADLLLLSHERAFVAARLVPGAEDGALRWAEVCRSGGCRSPSPGLPRSDVPGEDTRARSSRRRRPGRACGRSPRTPAAPAHRTVCRCAPAVERRSGLSVDGESR